MQYAGVVDDEVFVDRGIDRVGALLVCLHLLHDGAALNTRLAELIELELAFVVDGDHLHGADVVDGCSVIAIASIGDAILDSAEQCLPHMARQDLDIKSAVLATRVRLAAPELDGLRLPVDADELADER